jgi:hypothetical protein
LTLDDLRAKYPHLGFAVYAYTPGGPVTLECLTPDGTTYKFHGPTEAAAIAAGFAEEDETPVEPPSPPPAPPPVSVFD